jgi:hypothetical protein
VKTEIGVSGRRWRRHRRRAFLGSFVSEAQTLEAWGSVVVLLCCCHLSLNLRGAMHLRHHWLLQDDAFLGSVLPATHSPVSWAIKDGGYVDEESLGTDVVLRW